MLKLLNKCKSIVTNSISSEEFVVDVDTNFWKNQNIFCPYQIKMVTDKNPVTVVEKGRQIGASYTYAYRASMQAIEDRRDSIITSYNKAAVKQFIKDCCYWIKIFNKCFKIISYQEIVNLKDLNIYEIRLLNGRTITGLAGDSVNLRSYSGRDIYIDEACYRTDPLEDILAAGLAAIIHGGTIRILSTHAGIDSDFNKLILASKAKKNPYFVMSVSFRQAVSEGLFKRICSKNGDVWSQELEDSWVTNLYAMYGVRASEELDAVPSDYSVGGKIFYDFKYFDMSDVPDYDILRFRYHDLAATDSSNLSACYSASVQISYIVSLKKFVITNWTAEQLSPLDGDRAIEELAVSDGATATQIIEQEPGSTGIKYVSIMCERLATMGLYQVYGYAPRMEKIKRAIPAGNAFLSGEMMIDTNLNDRDEFTSIITKFCSKKQPLITDLADCVSGCYDYIKSEYNFLY